MVIELYPLLGTNSKRAMRRKTGKFGKIYTYRPRRTLLERLAQETGLTPSQVRDKLMEEREFLLTHTNIN